MFNTWSISFIYFTRNHTKRSPTVYDEKALLMPKRNESILSTYVLIRLKFRQHNSL